MHPFLFKIGNFPVGTYGLILVIGFALGLTLAKRLGKRDGIPGESLSDLSVSLLLAGIIGAKVLMLIVDVAGGMPLSQVLDPAYLRAGGAVHGGIIAGTAAFFWRVKSLKLKIPVTLDALTPGVALGQAIGRLGCFSAGCCYGTSCHLPWAVTFTNPDAHWLSNTPLGQPLHPVQIYTMLANLAVMGVLLLVRGRRAFLGQVGALFFILEGLQRLITEIWRADLDRGFVLGIPWLSTGRLTALSLMVFGAILLVLFRRHARAEAKAA
jgi:phosphatidylglycerol:prolipoprotein diacylglycerol transferase